MTNDLPIAVEDTEQPSEEPNKFKYAEFSGSQGRRYLHHLVKQIILPALYDQWDAATSYQVDGNTCYVGNRRMKADMAVRANLDERTTRWRWEQMRYYGLVKFVPRIAEFAQDDGSSQYVPVLDKDFDALYDLAYTFHQWLHSPNYFPPTRENAAIVLQTNQELATWLSQFYSYRKVFTTRKPGRKPKARLSYTCTLEQTIAAAAQAAHTAYEHDRNDFSNSFGNTFAAKTKEFNNNLLEKRDTSSLLEGEGATAIRNTITSLDPDRSPNEEDTNAPPTPNTETEETKERRVERSAAQATERREVGHVERESAPLGVDIDFEYLREIMTELSERYNNAPALESNMTQLRRLIESRGRHISQQEVLEKMHKAGVATGKKDDGFFNYRDEEGRPVKMPYFFKIFRDLMLPGSHVYRRTQRAAKQRQETQQTPLPVLPEQEPDMEYTPPAASERSSVARSHADKERREEYARAKRWKLLQLGVVCPTVQREHRCGCPVYSEHKGNRKCAWCESPTWNTDAMHLLREIMEM